MSIYSFTIVLDTWDTITNELEDKLYEAGCDDALLYFVGNTSRLDFDRKAESLDDAIKSAIKNVSCVLGEDKIISIDVIRAYRDYSKIDLEIQTEIDAVEKIFGRPFIKNQPKEESEGICFDCETIKFVYHIIHEPNIDSSFFPETYRKTEAELICSKCKTVNTIGSIKVEDDLLLAEENLTSD